MTYYAPMLGKPVHASTTALQVDLQIRSTNNTAAIARNQTASAATAVEAALAKVRV